MYENLSIRFNAISPDVEELMYSRYWYAIENKGRDISCSCNSIDLKYFLKDILQLEDEKTMLYITLKRLYNIRINRRRTLTYNVELISDKIFKYLGTDEVYHGWFMLKENIQNYLDRGTMMWYKAISLSDVQGKPNYMILKDMSQNGMLIVSKIKFEIVEF